MAISKANIEAAIRGSVERIEIAKDLELRKGSGIKLFDAVLKAGPGNIEEVQALTGGMGCEKVVECSANANARLIMTGFASCCW